MAILATHQWLEDMLKIKTSPSGTRFAIGLIPKIKFWGYLRIPQGRTTV
jgi:hypothetical protein